MSLSSWQPSYCFSSRKLYLPSIEAITPAIRKTALNSVHRAMGAKVVEFNGWDMPVEYPPAGGIIAEHNAVRTGVGIFDVSHMGDIRLSGLDALAAVQHISMNDASRLAIGQAHYSALLYPQGTFVDDVIVHRLAEADYLLVINAGTREKDFNWVRDNTRQFNCKVENLSDEFTQIAIHGPKGVELLQKLTDADLERFCKMDKPDFIGRAALEKAKAEGVKRMLVGLEMIERGIARDGYKVLDETGSEIGYVTSGSFAPFLKKNIALAYVPPQFAALGATVKVEIRGQVVKAHVVPTPFYKRPKKN